MNFIVSEESAQFLLTVEPGHEAARILRPRLPGRTLIASCIVAVPAGIPLNPLPS